MTPELSLKSGSVPKTLTVSQLNRLIHDGLEEAFPEIWVEGEISDPKTYPSGHTYFTLKDAESGISAVLFKGDASRLRFSLEQGLAVLARGRVSTYLKRGQLQFIVNIVEPVAQGALQLAFEQLKARLAAEGLFAEERKKPIPPFPERVGIVTSLHGAAIRDILSVLRRRFEGLHIRIYPVAVQGESAAGQIAQAVADFNRHLPDTDVLLVGRGGGSLEDLWAFNEEVVARAIAASVIPVISCVGHETDFTIADFAADLRAPTPSAAAELVVRDKEEVLARLYELGRRLPAALGNLLARYQETLRHILGSPFLKDPRRLFEEASRRIDELAGRLLSAPGRLCEERSRRTAEFSARLFPAMHNALSHAGKDFRMAAGRLHALSPLAILSRGYAIAFTEPGGRAIRSARDLKARDSVRVRVHEGQFIAEVKDIL